MLLEAKQRTKLDDSDDHLFYSFPRFVTHLDEGFIDKLTNLYRDRLQPNTRIFDMMSSWISHLPEEVEFAHVEEQGVLVGEMEVALHLRIDAPLVRYVSLLSTLVFLNLACWRQWSCLLCLIFCL